MASSDPFFGGVTSLAEHLDKTVLLVLRDGRVLLGTLASYDQYCSVVLEHARERHVAGGAYADVDMGLYLVRGESIALLGEVDDALDSSPPLLTRGVWDTVRSAEEEEEALIKAAAAARAVLTAAGRGGSVVVTMGGNASGMGAAPAADGDAAVSAETLLRAATAVSAGAKLAARGGGSLRRILWGFD